MVKCDTSRQQISHAKILLFLQETGRNFTDYLLPPLTEIFESGVFSLEAV